MISSTNTINPTIPPPVPACHGFADCTDMGAASASAKKESSRRAARTMLNMAMVVCGDFACGFER
jgi:hypothetical protein